MITAIKYIYIGVNLSYFQNREAVMLLFSCKTHFEGSVPEMGSPKGSELHIARYIMPHIPASILLFKILS